MVVIFVELALDFFSPSIMQVHQHGGGTDWLLCACASLRWMAGAEQYELAVR
jgi:hypothetical protein